MYRLRTSIFLNFIYLLIVLNYASSVPTADEVTSLPGLKTTINFKHYSGFLEAAPNKNFHYWYTESMRSPETAPFLLWLNGGPGCSSIGGLIEELGPFKITDNGNTVVINPWSWNTYFNVLFIESPAGVGYSYATDGNVTIDDYEVAQENYQALIQFYNRYPELKTHDFYITGESYSGVYLPTLGVKLVNDKTNFPNFKGMAIGNGVLSFPLNYATMVPLYYYHAIVRDELYQRLSSTCCNGNVENCDIMGLFNNLTCKPIISELFDAADELDSYNLYQTCYFSDQGPTMNKYAAIKRGIFHEHYRKLKTEKKIKKHVQFDVPTGCMQINNTFIYMNRLDVRKALHIPTSLPVWTDCNDEVTNNYGFRYYNMTSQLQKLSSAGVRILIYNGDVDTVCNHVMNAKVLASLDKKIIGPEVVNQPWIYDKAMLHDNIAGMQLKYEGGIDFLTVRGSGHFVPQDKPREALQMIYNFVNQIDYSTPVPK